MIKGIIAPGYNISDNCHKYTNDDSTIECYVYTREALLKPIKTTDKELNTNSVYALVGTQDDEIKVYVGQGCKAERPLHRVRQHLNSYAERNESYYPYWNIVLVFVCRNEEEGLKWGTDTLDDLEALLIRDTQNRYSWNSKDERVKNPLTSEKIRSYARKLLDIKEYVKYLGFNFFDKEEQPKDDVNVTYDERLDAEEKQLIDNTVELTTINLEPNATIPEYTTPEAVVKEMIEKLPWDEFDDTTKFFDPACKGGEFLALIHDKMMERLNEIGFKSEVKESERKYRIHDHIVANQLFGIAIGENSYRVAKERAYNCPNIIKAPDNYIYALKQFRILNKAEDRSVAKAGINIIECERKLISKEFNREMQFDVVIGNPPYQGADGKSSIYPEFVENATDISDIVCMITRDNWLNGMAFEDMRAHLMKNGGVTEIKHYPVVGELFTNVGVAVAYFLWRRDFKGKAKYTRIEQQNKSKPRDVNITSIITSDIASSIVDKIPITENWGEIYNSRSYPFMDQRKRYNLEHSDKPDEYYNVAVMVNKGKPVFTNIGNFQNMDEVKRYKVLCGVVINEALADKPGNVLTNVKALPPMQVGSETWSLIATFNTELETVNCKKYVKTKFFRFLANQTVNNRANVTRNAFKYVPNQDFRALDEQSCTDKEKIDWSQSITNIDQQLYKKYNLTDAEISYIESTIKPMDTEPSKQKFTPQDVMANYINSQLQQQSK